jgi:hypothetical protein
MLRCWCGGGGLMILMAVRWLLVLRWDDGEVLRCWCGGGGLMVLTCGCFVIVGVEMGWWWGAEMLMWWCLDLASPVCGWCRVWLIFLWYLILWTFPNLLRFVRFFSSLWWFSNLVRSASFLYLVDLYHVDVDCLETVCEQRFICLDSHCTVVPSIFYSRSCVLK